MARTLTYADELAVAEVMAKWVVSHDERVSCGAGDLTFHRKQTPYGDPGFSAMVSTGEKVEEYDVEIIVRRRKG